MLDNGVEPNIAFESLTTEEAIALSQVYTDDKNVSLFTELNTKQLEEVETIDYLAGLYYDYYEVNGYTDDIESVNIPMTYATPTNSEVMLSIDYSYTVYEIASHLARIGKLMSLTGALPFLCLASMLTGIALFVYSIATIYSALGDAVNEQISIWYVKSIEKLYNSKIKTAVVCGDIIQGKKYWSAHRVDINGLGGVVPDYWVDENTAKLIVGTNDEHYGLLCKEMGEASYIITSAGYSPYGPETHDHVDGVYKPLNQPHFHPMLNSIKLKTHIWYFAI